MQSLKNRISLLEQDLESAEDRADGASTKLKETESSLEAAQHENNQLKRQLDSAEGSYYRSCIYGKG